MNRWSLVSTRVLSGFAIVLVLVACQAAPQSAPAPTSAPAGAQTSAPAAAPANLTSMAIARTSGPASGLLFIADDQGYLKQADPSRVTYTPRLLN